MGPNELDEDVLQRAFNIVTLAGQSSAEVAKMIDTSERGKTTQYVVDVLRRNGGVLDRTGFIKRVYRHVNAQEFDMIMMTLQEAGVVVVEKKDKLRFYKMTRLVDE
jgi:transposase